MSHQTELPFVVVGCPSCGWRSRRRTYTDATRAGQQHWQECPRSSTHWAFYKDDLGGLSDLGGRS